MEYIISAIIGYLFGCINTASIVSRKKGIDIKKVGSNNAGASNVFISVGKMYGVFVAVIDVFKSLIAASLVYYLFEENLSLAILAGAMVIVGHNFPFWMKFNGGKGLAPFMGLILFYNCKVFIAFGIILIAITLITDYIAIGSLTLCTLMPAFVWFNGEGNIIIPVFVVLAVIMWFKHRDNLKRLLTGTEIGFLRKNKVKK